MKRHLRSILVEIGCVLLLVTGHVAMAADPQQLLTRFLDLRKPPEQRANALGALITNEEGVRALTDAAAKRDDSVTKAMSALFEAAPSDFCEMVMFATVRTGDRDSYRMLRDRGLRDKDSTVRASTFSAALMFADNTPEVIEAVTKEIQAAHPGGAVHAAAQFAARYEVSEAIGPLLELLKNGNLGSRQLAAQALAAYSSHPEKARPVLLSAVEVARKDAAQLEDLYQALPSVRNPSGNNAPTNLQEHLKQALRKIKATPREATVPPEESVPMPINPAAAPVPKQPPAPSSRQQP